MHEPSHVANHMFSLKPVLTAQTFPHIRVEYEAVNIDGVAHEHIIPMLHYGLAEIILAGFQSASEVVCHVEPQHLLADPLQCNLIVEVQSLPVGVVYPCRYAGTLCAVQRIQPQSSIVDFQHTVLRMLTGQLLEEPDILRIMQWVKSGRMEYSRSHVRGFLVVCTRFQLVTYEVELYLVTVNVAVVVHQHGLYSATVQVADGMQNSYHNKF